MTEQKPTAEAVRVAETIVDWPCGMSMAGYMDRMKAAIATLITAKDTTIKACNDALQSYEHQVVKLEGYLERAGWRRCDIAACNCNGYHNWNPSREEIEEPLREQITAKDAEIERLRGSIESAIRVCESITGKLNVSERQNQQQRALLVEAILEVKKLNGGTTNHFLLNPAVVELMKEVL